MFKTLNRIVTALERQAISAEKSSAILEKSATAAVEGWRCHNDALEIQKKMAGEQDKINKDYYQFKDQFLNELLGYIQSMDLESAEKLIKKQMEQK